MVVLLMIVSYQGRMMSAIDNHMSGSPALDCDLIMVGFLPCSLVGMSEGIEIDSQQRL